MQSKQPSPTPCVSAAECLRNKKREILDRWEKQVRQQLPSSNKRNHYALTDSLPEFLDKLSDSLEQRKPKVVDMSKIAQSHARDRASYGDYTQKQVQTEYTILRRVLLRPLIKT